MGRRGTAIEKILTASRYHTISNHSPRVNKLGNKLDYVGIILLITGSFIPSIYFSFWCDSALQKVYWTMVRLLVLEKLPLTSVQITSLGALCTVVSVMERFRTPLYRPFRAGMFVTLGLSALFPVLHGLKMFGIEQMRNQAGLSWLVLQGVLYIVGASIYAARIPEKWYPGRFDVVGSSHQIFHVLVVAAAASHLVGLLKAFDYRHSIMGGLCI